MCELFIKADARLWESTQPGRCASTDGDQREAGEFLLVKAGVKLPPATA